MEKIVIRKPGNYDRLEVEAFPTPDCKDDQVLIDVKYAGINYADVLVRWGVYKSAKEFVGWPITPGFEVSGEVIATGKNITHVSTGDKVIGVSLFNGYSTQITLLGDQVFKLPDGLGLSQAAALPATYITAYHALFQNFVTRPGMKFLVHSAAGGVGTALIQLSQLLNCEVTGVIGREEKRKYLKDLGVKNIICKATENWVESARKINPEGYDAVFDANGATTLRDSYNLLAPTGKVVCYGFHSMLPKEGGRLNYFKLIKTYFQTPRFNPLDMTSDNKSLITFNLSFLFNRKYLLAEAMEYVLKAIQDKKLLPPMVTEFDFKDVAKAHKSIESGTTTGKLVLKV